MLVRGPLLLSFALLNYFSAALANPETVLQIMDSIEPLLVVRHAFQSKAKAFH
jgi:hypothetical protein